MVRNVLIVDDDRILRKLVEKKCLKYSDRFAVLPAGDGLEAIDVLKKSPISLIVTDLQMPNMDGFELMAHLTVKYPDIPVIILTGYKAPAWRKDFLKETAASYIEKPFVVEKLVETILAALQKQSEGGMLNTISLEMFIQLVSMDVKTCTLRVGNPAMKEEGVLLFKDGELLDARLGEERGKPAALKIMSWEKTVLYIQDSVPIKERNIQDDVQALLMDAMRLRDEAGADPDSFLEE